MPQKDTIEFWPRTFIREQMFAWLITNYVPFLLCLSQHRLCPYSALLLPTGIDKEEKKNCYFLWAPALWGKKTALFGEESQSLLSNAEANKFQQPEGSKSFNRFSACGQKQAPGTALPGGDSQRGRTKSCRAGQRHCPSLLWDRAQRLSGNWQRRNCRARLDKQSDVFAAFLFFLCLSCHPLISAQHLHQVQSQAELEPAGAVTLAKWSSRQWPQSGLLGLFKGISHSRAKFPAQNPRKREFQAVVAATSHRHYPRGTYFLLLYLWCLSAMHLNMVHPWLWSWCQGQGMIGKAAGVWMPYLGFRMTVVHLQRNSSLFLAKLPWVTHMHWQSSSSADASQDGCAFLHGARVSPAEHTASCMRKLQRRWVLLLGSTAWQKSHCIQWETWHSTAPAGTASFQYCTGSSTASHSISKIILSVVGWWRDTEELSPVCLWHTLTGNPNLCTVLSICVVSPSSSCWQYFTSCSPGYYSLFCVKVILLTHVHLHVLQDPQGFSVKSLYSNFTKLILDISVCEYFPATCSQSHPLSAGLPVSLLWYLEGHAFPSQSGGLSGKGLSYEGAGRKRLYLRQQSPEFPLTRK